METHNSRTILCITADLTSNGPHLLYPNPLNPGGKPDAEDWIWDNFGYDPFAHNAMLDTAENVARDEEITIEEQHEVALLRDVTLDGFLAGQFSYAFCIAFKLINRQVFNHDRDSI